MLRHLHFFYSKSQHGWIFKGYMHGGFILTNMPNDENGVPIFVVAKLNMALVDLTNFYDFMFAAQTAIIFLSFLHISQGNIYLFIYFASTIFFTPFLSVCLGRRWNASNLCKRWRFAGVCHYRMRLDLITFVPVRIIVVLLLFERITLGTWKYISCHLKTMFCILMLSPR